MAFTQLAYMATVTTDVIMMGWLGVSSLAAGSLAGNFFWLFETFAFGFLYAVGPIMAQHLGARRFGMVRPTVRQGLWVVVLIGVPCIIIIWQSKFILVALGQDAGLAASAQSYLRAMSVGLIPGLWYMVFCEFLAAHARPRMTLVISVMGIGLNALANYALMFGNFGLPRLELVGAGIATTMVNTIMLLAILVFVRTDRNFRRYRLLGRFWRADWAQLAEIVRIGFPIAITNLSEMGMFLTAALLMGLISTDALAAHAVVTQSCAIALMVPLGTSEAAAIRVGRAIGAAEYLVAARVGWIAMGMSAIFILLPAMSFWVFGTEIIGLFLDLTLPENQKTIELGMSFLAIAALFLVADAVQLSARGALRGLKDTRGPMIIALTSYWGLGITTAGLFGVYLELGGQAIWIALALSWSVVAVLLIMRFRNQVSTISVSSKP